MNCLLFIIYHKRDSVVVYRPLRKLTLDIQSLDVIYAEIERAAVENTRDVASMFDDRNGGTSCRQQQRRSQIRSPRRVASADRKGRGVLDVSMPGDGHTQ